MICRREVEFNRSKSKLMKQNLNHLYQCECLTHFNFTIFLFRKILIEETYNTLLPGKLDTSVEDCPNPLASLLFSNANRAANSSNS